MDHILSSPYPTSPPSPHMHSSYQTFCSFSSAMPLQDIHNFMSSNYNTLVLYVGVFLIFLVDRPCLFLVDMPRLFLVDTPRLFLVDMPRLFLVDTPCLFLVDMPYLFLVDTPRLF